jgi:hypothetical protein
MGLDMYAYAGRPGQREEYWEQYGSDIPEVKKVSKPREIAYWRKHPNLHGWMEQLWISKGKPGTGNTDADFNGIELELTEEDINMLEQDILDKSLPSTRGFFFGDDADDHYNEQDIEFIATARAELFLGQRVFYNSSW